MVIRCILFAILCLASSSAAYSQNYVVIDSGVRKELAKAWDTHNPKQAERAYCATYRTDVRWDVPVFRVTRIHRARTALSTPSFVIYYCEAGEAQLHTHPPTTCDENDKCQFGGPDAYQCFPSDIDTAALLTPPAAPFGLIQCDKYAVVFYFPPPTPINRMVPMQP